MNHESVLNDSPSVLSDYLQWIQGCYDTLQSNCRPLFFRGHANKEWVLIPAVFRKSQYKERDINLDYKQTLVSECYYISLMERILIEMQHHQIPTRLLDWSISPLVALYFACSSIEDMDKDAMVYAMNPWAAYKSIKPCKEVPTYYLEIMKEARLCCALGWSFEEIRDRISQKFHYDINSLELQSPLPVVGRYMDERVKTQQGCFTIWGTDKSSLDFFLSYKPNLKSITISANVKPILLNSLSQLGISEFSFFSDKEGMSNSVRRSGSIFRL